MTRTEMQSQYTDLTIKIQEMQREAESGERVSIKKYNVLRHKRSELFEKMRITGNLF